MLTSLSVRNFRHFTQAEIELGSPVVFIGPNNSGKTTALQDLALWGHGVRRWVARRGNRPAPTKRPGVAINRRDLVAIPMVDANQLRRNLHVRDVTTVGGRPRTQTVRLEVIVTGTTSEAAWTCDLLAGICVSDMS